MEDSKVVIRNWIRSLRSRGESGSQSESNTPSDHEHDRTGNQRPPRHRHQPEQIDRGQAYTLEGFIGAVVVLTAVLLAVQSIVITPTTGGAVDRSIQAQLQGETKDALTVADNNGDLSHLVRYWNVTDVDEGEVEGVYYNSDDSPARTGNYTSDQFANSSAMSDRGSGAFEFKFGPILEERFTESGRSYNVEVAYQVPNGASESFYLVYQGQPSPSAFSASQSVTLSDDQRLTADSSRDETLAGTDGYPIPNIDEDNDSLYNVVEVRLVVW